MRKLFTFLLALAASVGASWAAPAVAVNGKLPGAFSVSPTKVVYFSQGNLQYVGTWQFADNQWDYFGTSQSNNHRDLFGWGTNGTSGHNPNNTSQTNNDYSWAEWGTNTITNGGTGWRTLTKDEWVYLFNTRTVKGGTGNGKSYTYGQSVNGKLGVVLYPDDYTGAAYTGSDWSTFEDKGCVFLPAAGYRGGTIEGLDSYGFYWSSTSYSGTQAYCVFFTGTGVDPADKNDRSLGFSVRLVSDIAPIVNYTITFKNYDGTTLQSGEVVKGATPSYTGTTPVKPSTAAYSYTFSGWSPTIVAATADATYTAQYNQAPNQATVNDVIAKINAIGEVAYTPECKDKIDVARNAYNALTDEQKALVSNYATLTAAEARYAYLTPVEITPKEDPKNEGTYYSTYYDGNRLLMLPENVEAYVASISGSALALELIAEAGETLPAATAVILRSTVTPFTLLPQDDGAVDLTAVENALQGVDDETAIAAKVSGTCYVLSGTAEEGVGFYKYLAPNQLKAHKAFVDLGATQSGAPRRLRFVFEQENTATAIDNTDASAKIGGSEKFLEDGQLVIIKNGVKYNAQGQIVK